ncbi:Uu.00g093470.m01.CDS01 [Anthostomella pinea]|uniref:Uu.00g093470.m01.CDS01 n=1 Tax=Anthostomella pinea TaxID=933095 RepID=A0AAI8YKG0_9PEZI|nr:Uu.00g093470.m01.CDS01 [Anthostomella pinea]
MSAGQRADPARLLQDLRPGQHRRGVHRRPAGGRRLVRVAPYAEGNAFWKLAILPCYVLACELVYHRIGVEMARHGKGVIDWEVEQDVVLLVGISLGHPVIEREASLTSQLQAICKAGVETQKDGTPLDEPLLRWEKPAKRGPRDFLKPHEKPFRKGVAQWQKKISSLVMTLTTRNTNPRPRLSLCGLTRLLWFTSTVFGIWPRRGEQMIVYVPPSVLKQVRAMREDDHFVVIDDYKTVWDFPNNKHQKENFEVTQPKLFRQFDGWSDDNKWRRRAAYNNAHLSETYNAKWFITYDAVMRNPFGSDKWMYADAGFLDELGPKDEHGQPWGMLLDKYLNENKFARSIGLSQHTGISTGRRHHERLLDRPTTHLAMPSLIANAWFGSSLGLLEFSVRYMKTVEDMSENGFYVGHEEFVISHVFIRYRNLGFSVPFFRQPAELNYVNYYPAKALWSQYGGSSMVAPINDPMSTLFCPKEYN